jgi:P27 family predicted phage terminase small subunit
MAKKLELITATSEPDANAMPSGLGDYGQSLWNRVMNDYDVADVGGREMLAQACFATDIIARCRDDVDKHGVLIKTKTGMRENPAAKLELAYRAFVVRTLQKLGLDVEPIRSTPGRPIGYA